MIELYGLLAKWRTRGEYVEWDIWPQKVDIGVEGSRKTNGDNGFTSVSWTAVVSKHLWLSSRP